MITNVVKYMNTLEKALINKKQQQGLQLQMVTKCPNSLIPNQRQENSNKTHNFIITYTVCHFALQLQMNHNILTYKYKSPLLPFLQLAEKYLKLFGNGEVNIGKSSLKKWLPELVLEVLEKSVFILLKRLTADEAFTYTFIHFLISHRNI